MVYSIKEPDTACSVVSTVTCGNFAATLTFLQCWLGLDDMILVGVQLLDFFCSSGSVGLAVECSFCFISVFNLDLGLYVSSQYLIFI